MSTTDVKRKSMPKLSAKNERLIHFVIWLSKKLEDGAGQDLRDMAKVTSTTEEQIEIYDAFENDEEEVRKEYLETKNAKRYINKEKKLKSSLEEKEKNKNEKKKRKLDLKNGKAVKKARSSGPVSNSGAEEGEDNDDDDDDDRSEGSDSYPSSRREEKSAMDIINEEDRNMARERECMRITRAVSRPVTTHTMY